MPSKELRVAATPPPLRAQTREQHTGGTARRGGLGEVETEIKTLPPPAKATDSDRPGLSRCGNQKSHSAGVKRKVLKKKKRKREANHDRAWSGNGRN